MPAAAKRLGAAGLASIVISAVGAPSLHAEGETPMPCTLIGCTSGIGLEVSKVKRGVDRISFCVRARCKRVDVEKRRPRAYVKVACSEEVTVRGVLTSKDADGRRLERHTAMIRLYAVHPNGPGCGPTCFWGGARFNGSELVVLPPPA